MKKLTYIISFTTIVSLSACCSLTDTEAWADLLWSTVIQLTESQDTPDYTEYNVQSNYTNEPEVESGCDCNDYDDASNFDLTENVYYQEQMPQNNNWGSPVDNSTIDVNQLETCQNSDLNSILQFLVDGYYLIERILDSNNQVAENNNDNNYQSSGKKELEKPVNSKKRIYTIIKVEGKTSKAAGTPKVVRVKTWIE